MMRLFLTTALLIYTWNYVAFGVAAFSSSFRGTSTLLDTNSQLRWTSSSVRRRRDQQDGTEHSFFTLLAVPGADIEQETALDGSQPQVIGNTIIYRGKMNEIDYCIAPADVSLSRAYSQPKGDDTGSGGGSNDGPSGASQQSPTSQTMSLTQALNNASNRAVRRILLARCWPSEEALNMSLRLAAAAEKQAEEARMKSGESTSTAKCPVPRPILNLLMRKATSESSAATGTSKVPPSGVGPSSSSAVKTRTNQEYVVDQIAAFRERYGSLAGYEFAEAYLESVLSLATTGDESPRVKEVLESGVYDESYRRVISMLKSVGVVLDSLPDTDRFRLSTKLQDQNFCLSMMDILAMKKESSLHIGVMEDNKAAIEEVDNSNSKEKEDDSPEVGSVNTGLNRFRLWKKDGETNPTRDFATYTSSSNQGTQQKTTTSTKPMPDDDKVILCSDVPSMTRQLNGLSNIVHRGLLFGGDQELLVLSETLAENRETFAKRWYPGTIPPTENMDDESRSGIQYLNALISLLRLAYDEGVVTNLDPLVSLSASYSNSFERLMASLVEMGSGYIRPEVENVMSMPKPRTAQEELGRFAVWEAAFRSGGGEKATYPDDLEGTWEVKDEVGGETIGISTVTLAPLGEVVVAPPLQGLRWRLDPGPTHLDTCTFQVLSEDGTVLQYRGFIDRGSRVEARFSGRSTRIRGSVMFQMRNGGVNYWKDMLPVNYKAGTTKFEMTKKVAQS